MDNMQVILWQRIAPLALIYLYDIGETLEGVERQSNGQSHGEGRRVERSPEGVRGEADVGNREGVVFKDEEYGAGDRDARQQKDFGASRRCGLNTQRGEVVDGNQTQEHQNVNGLVNQLGSFSL
jgi:hypothetical protein